MVVFDPAIEHRVRRLVDEQRRAEVAQDGRRLARPVRVVRGNPRVQRAARAHCGVQRAHRLLEWCVRVEAVGVEDVDVVEAHPGQRLVERREEVLARAPLAVRSGPHVVARLGRDHQLVAIGLQVVGEHPAEVDLRRAVGRPVVVRQVEVRYPDVEGTPHDRPLRLVRPVVTEVVPQPERKGRQLQAAPAAPAVLHRVVAVVGRGVCIRRHARSVREKDPGRDGPDRIEIPLPSTDDFPSSPRSNV